MTRAVLLRALSAAALVVSALASTGCLKTEAKETLAKDGSGTLVRDVSLDLEAMTTVAEMMKQFNPGAPAGEAGADGETWIDPAKVTEALKAKAAKVPGVKIEKLESVEDAKAKRLRIHVEVSFTDLDSLAKSGLLINEGFDLRKNADGTWTLDMDPIAGQSAAIPNADGTGGNDVVSAMLPMIEPVLESLEAKHVLVLPTAATATNGTKSEDGRTVTWNATWKDVREKKVVRSVTFSGEGLEWKPRKHTPDAMALVKLFSPVPKPKAPAPDAAPAGSTPAPAPTTPAPTTPPEKPAEKPADPPPSTPR